MIHYLSFQNGLILNFASACYEDENKNVCVVQNMPTLHEIDGHGDVLSADASVNENA